VLLYDYSFYSLWVVNKVHIIFSQKKGIVEIVIGFFYFSNRLVGL